MGDARTIREQIEPIWMPGSVYELRILYTKKATVSGYFDDLDAFARAAAAWDGKAPSVYMTLNPVSPVLLARASNHVREYARATTSDSDIERRTWLPLDFDPIRPAEMSSTDEEHELATQRARDAGNWLAGQGFPPASMVLADSGNGGHLLVRLDLPNTEGAQQLVRRCLEAVSIRFTDDRVKVDLTMGNAARIWKVYGTTACKGDNTAERPHRQARILAAPGWAA